MCMKMGTRSVRARRRRATHHTPNNKVVHKLRLWDFAAETTVYDG